MSRLFDALKSAASSHHGVDGKAGEELWEALGVHGEDPLRSRTDTPRVVDDPDVMRASMPINGLDDDLAADYADEEFVQAQAHPLQDSLGTATEISFDLKARLIPHAVDSVVAEHYRRLRTKIMQQQEYKAFRSLVVTSAGPQEGKSVTVLNLGLSFAMLPSLKILVVDGDLRKGTMGSWLGVDNQHVGLSNLIDGSAQLEDVLLKSEKIPMHFMLRGNTQVRDLDSSQLSFHFQRLIEQYDLILVDSAPVNLIADVQLLAASCDAVLLVARAFSTPQKAFQKAARDLAGFRVIGTVLNAGASQRYSYDEGYY
jgi:capsular exopolysaccharide synthesis family protein